MGEKERRGESFWLALFLFLKRQYVIFKSMKILLASVLILSFISIAVFGIWGMHPGAAHTVTRCLASLVHGSFCPEVNNALATVDFHFNAIKNFVSVVLIFAVLVIAFVVLADFAYTSQSSVARQHIKSFQIRSAFSNQRFNRWLALHENSPTKF